MAALTQAPREQKSCGHWCCPSTVATCCACADERPVLDRDTYPSYTDGAGWIDTGCRDDGYCPVCNTKNFEAWLKRMSAELAQKAHADAQAARAADSLQQAALEDKARFASTEATRFEYANGDVFEGGMVDGSPQGHGTMTYADGTGYEGLWKAGLHEGTGTKNWMDGISYAGEWSRGMMHGQGRYVMASAFGEEVMEGRFEEDEFCGG